MSPVNFLQLEGWNRIADGDMRVEHLVGREAEPGLTQQYEGIAEAQGGLTEVPLFHFWRVRGARG